jgi:hypothetical protein
MQSPIFQPDRYARNCALRAVPELPEPFYLSFCSDLFVIPQQFICHSAAKRWNLLFVRPTTAHTFTEMALAITVE